MRKMNSAKLKIILSDGLAGNWKKIWTPPPNLGKAQKTSRSWTGSGMRGNRSSIRWKGSVRATNLAAMSSRGAGERRAAGSRRSRWCRPRARWEQWRLEELLLLPVDDVVVLLLLGWIISIIVLLFSCGWWCGRAPSHPPHYWLSSDDILPATKSSNTSYIRA